MTHNIEITTEAFTIGAIDAIEVHPLCKVAEGIWDVCEEKDADSYSVYVHETAGSITDIANCPTKESAYDFAKLIETIIAKSAKPQDFHYLHSVYTSKDLAEILAVLNDLINWATFNTDSIPVALVSAKLIYKHYLPLIKI